MSRALNRQSHQSLLTRGVVAGLCNLSSRALILARALGRLVLALVLIDGALTGVPAAAEPGPMWITPLDGETVPYPNDLVFEVAPVNGAVGYLYGFKENDQFVWENNANEGHLDGTRYILTKGSTGYFAVGNGANGQVSWPLQIWVRAYILQGGQYHWTEASIINTTLVGFGCIYGPRGSCLPSCPDVLFFFARGTNEMLRDDTYQGLGKEGDSTWKLYTKNRSGQPAAQ